MSPQVSGLRMGRWEKHVGVVEEEEEERETNLCVEFVPVFAETPLGCFALEERDEITPAHLSSPQKMLALALQKERLVFLPISLKSL